MNDNGYQPQAAHAPSSEEMQRLRKLVNKARIAMVTTIDAHEELRSRPLQTLEMDEQGTLWFVVEVASPKSQEVSQHEGKVCLAYANTGDNEYVSITGHATLDRDPQRKAALWNKMIEVWFPKGQDDPKIALLKVEPERAEYWDGPGNAIASLYAFAKAAATGSKDGFGQNAKLEF